MHLSVVSYRNSTSNHNRVCGYSSGRRVVSYRNSTSNHNNVARIFSIVSVVSYRNSTSNHNQGGSIAFNDRLYLIEILHQTTTSARARTFSLCCILSKFYIKPQHLRVTKSNASRCILSKFYIKPQHGFCFDVWCFVVSYRNSTSNHNYRV